MISCEFIKSEMKFCPTDKKMLCSLFKKYKQDMSDYCLAFCIKNLYPIDLKDIYNGYSMKVRTFVELLNFKQYGFIIESLSYRYLKDLYLEIFLKHILLEGEYFLYPRVFNDLYWLIRDNINDNCLINILEQLLFSANTNELQNCCIIIYELVFGIDYDPIILSLVSRFHTNKNILDLSCEIITNNHVNDTYYLICILISIKKDIIRSFLLYNDFYKDLYIASCKNQNSEILNEFFYINNTIEFTNFLLG